MNRVVVTNIFVGVCHMQVCAVQDASDEEILAVCNRENPSGTSLGWTQVRRGSTGEYAHCAPVECEQDPIRIHYVVAC